MVVRMRTRYASARGTASPGGTINLPDEEAKALIKGGHAEKYVDTSAAAESPPAEPEQADDQPAETADNRKAPAETAADFKPRRGRPPKKTT